VVTGGLVLHRGNEGQQFGTAVVLAGGKSSRMGFNKELLKFNGNYLIDSTISILKKRFNEIIIISANPGLYKDRNDVLAYQDLINSNGPLAGIYTGLKVASSQYVYFVACDMPCISLEYIDYVKNLISNTEFDVYATKNEVYIEPFNAFYSKKLVVSIEKHISNNYFSVHSFLKKENCFFISDLEINGFNKTNIFTNLNTKEDISKFVAFKDKSSLCCR